MNNTLLVSSIFIFLSFMSCTSDDDEVETDIDYPSIGEYGYNILDTTNASLSGSDFSFAATVSTDAFLEVVLTSTSNKRWVIVSGTEIDWVVESYDNGTGSQIFRAVPGDSICDLKLEMQTGTYQLDFYENDEGKLSFSHQVTI